MLRLNPLIHVFPNGISYGRLTLLMTVFLCVLLGSFLVFDFDAARWFQSYAGYYFCTAAFAFAGYHCFRVRALFIGKIRQLSKQLRLSVLGVAIAGTYLLALHEPTEMRVFNDEPTHALTALSMAQERAVFAPGVGFYEGGGFVYADPEPTYRLYLYPYVVSLLHNLTGIRPINNFIANGFIGFFTLLATFLLGWQMGGRPAAGFAAQLLLLGLPLLHQVFNSAGYDLLNLFLFICFVSACLVYFRSGGLDLLNLSISLGVLLAYCRNESILYMSALAVLFLLRSIHEKSLRLSIFSTLSPVLLLVPLAARSLGARLDETMSVFYENIDTGFFGLRYFPDNSQKVLRWLFSTDSTNLNSLLITFLAIGALIALVFSWRVNRSSDGDASFFGFRAHDVILITFLGLAGLHLSLIMCLFWDPTEASAIRFFLPINFVFILCIVRGLFWLERRWGARLALPLSIIALAFAWLVTLPKAARAEVTHSSVTASAANRSLEWAKSHNDGRTLFAVRASPQFILHRLPTVSLRFLSTHTEDVFRLVKAGHYDRVILIELRYFNPESNTWTQPMPKMPIRGDLVSERIDGWRNFFHSETEIRSVIGLRADDGSITLMNSPSAELPKWSSEREYFNYIRSLHLLRGDHK